MAVPTLALQRRNSVVLFDARPCHSPPPPDPQTTNINPTAYTVPAPAPVSTPRRAACPARPRWESVQTVRRRRLEAAERAFQSTRRGEFTPALFSRLSRFPSRTLPPPGVRACNLDAVDAAVFMVGDMVRVRRFTLGADRAAWTEWQRGQVLLYLPMRAFLGNFGHAYVVRAVCARSGAVTVQQYAQFIGEIRSAEGPDDDAGAFTAEECAKRRIKANYIYTRIPSARKISGIPHKEVWTPAQVLTWEDGQDILVRSLAGPTAGLKFLVQDALPYTLEAAVACRRQGQNVVGYDGKLFLQDKEIKPLAEHLPGTLPLPSVRLPSPAVLAARPAPLFPSQKVQ
ncbi:hypothetical protein B0H10DRAFT_285438 [Mycena sp. CBHHK59/15]|nr:hypothetical protein B0H10DRAFT_285438 [Mycena sp. CBHHK59/15]